MIVLGLHFEHDAGACLMQDGEILISVEAERVTGKKHDFGLAAVLAAMQAAFEQTGIVAGEVDAIAFSDMVEDRVYRSKLDLLPEIEQHTHGAQLAACLGGFEASGMAALLQPASGGFRPDIPVFVACHSMAHAAAALHMSGFARATGLVIDGYGTCCGLMGYTYRDGVLARCEEFKDRFLLGAGYHGIGILAREIVRTQTLDVAGKVMGLQAYGTARADWVQYFRGPYFSSSANTGFDDFVRQSSRYTGEGSPERFCSALFPGGLGVGSMTVTDSTYCDLVASMQAAFTSIVCALVVELVGTTGEPEVFISGGCALNIIANSAVAQLPMVSSLFIPPNASDCGQAMGVAILGMHALTGAPLHSPTIPAARRQNPYIGARLMDDPAQAKVPDDIATTRFDWSSAVQVSGLAQRFIDGEIIGVIQGPSEIGPRALGNRSILALASHPGMKDLINHKIKRREWWRPFAPVCRLCDADRYFNSVFPSRYMLMNAWVREDWRQPLSSITHQDNTCRLQTLADRSENPPLWDLLASLEAAGAVPVLINTSFNLSRKPIANTTAEAIELLTDSQMDAVIVEGYLFAKTLEGRQQRERLEITPYVDQAFYDDHYPDVGAAGVAAVDHYVTCGWREQRDPNSWFSTERYLERYPDVLRSGANPLWDFVMFGWRAGRMASGREDQAACTVKFPMLCRSIDDSATDVAVSTVAAQLDPVFYRQQLDALQLQVENAGFAQHYLRLGAALALDPAPWFSTMDYLTTYEDVARTSYNPFLHYLCHGKDEGRKSAPSSAAVAS